MAENEKGYNEASSNGTDWEVVSLTASTYAASPGPVTYEPPSTDKEFSKNEKESHDANFMSCYFVFAKDEYEGLNIEAKHSELDDKFMQKDVLLTGKDAKVAGKSLEESYKTSSDDNLQGIDPFEKDKELSDGGIGFGKGKALHGEILFNSPKFEAFHSETGGSFHSTRGADVPDSVDLSGQNTDPQNTDPPLGYLNASADKKENKDVGSESSSEAWWRKQAVALYNYAREPNRFWSIFVAAAFVGLVILGQRKQREKSQLEQLKFHVNISDECSNSMLKPVNFKSIVVTDHQSSSLVDGGIRFSFHGTY